MKLLSVLLATVALAPQLALAAPDSDASNHSCPMWTVPKESLNGSFSCECENILDRIVICDGMDVYLASYHCMTFSEVFNRTVVGHCLYNLHQNAPPHRFYWKVPKLEHRDDTAMCQFVRHCVPPPTGTGQCTYYGHQTGLMCTSCADGYAYPVYSYSMACVECKDYKYNWLKYIAVAFLPLTAFYIIVVLFRITATSGAVNGYILMCQLITTPVIIRILTRVEAPSTEVGAYFSVLAIWNLDFFRGLYTPFCLHPKMTTLQTLMLDYVIAVYPLLLVILTYFCVKLHNRYSIVVWLWSPFYKCFALVRKEWDINSSLVGAFATFILLSYVKILNVSFYVLTPNTLYDVRGNKMPKYFLYYDGTYEYFGADHIPYALLALFMLLVFNIFPLVLLCLYPCRCFHRCLNFCKLRFIALHIFMDTFHGCYKLEPRDCRLFAAVYLFLRLLNHTFVSMTAAPYLYFPLTGIVLIVVTGAIALARPHKSIWHVVADVVCLLHLSVAYWTISTYELLEDFDTMSYLGFTQIAIVSPLLLFPPCYGFGLLVYFVIPKKVLLKLKTLLQRCKHIIRKPTETEEPLPYRFYHSEEYPPLLP